MLQTLRSILGSTLRALPPINAEGWPFIAGAAAVAVVLAFLSTSLFWIAFGLTLWVALFFRDPARVTPVTPGLVVSPADGRVSQVANAVPPPELGLGEAPRMRVSVFMSVFDGHVNRAPVAGRVARVAYRAGAFVNAELDKASEANERNGLVIESDHGIVGVVQIAGLVARRIVCWVREGEDVPVGGRFGMIRFGSRLDVYLPEGSLVLVDEGQTAVAGETVIAALEPLAAIGPRATRRS